MSEVRKLNLGNRSVTVEFERKRIKNINVRVRRDGTLYCSLPFRVSEKEAIDFIISKKDLLLDGIDKVASEEQNKSLSKKFVSGENFMVFGKNCKLNVVQRTHNSCHEDNGMIILEVTDPSDYRTKYMTYEKWRRASIRKVIVEQCNQVYPLFELRGVKPPKKITLGEYKSFWGECFSKRGELKFAYRLFEKDIELIRYVVVHEFAHFIEPNHSDRFWAIVADYVPDYKELRKKLNSKD